MGLNLLGLGKKIEDIIGGVGNAAESFVGIHPTFNQPQRPQQQQQQQQGPPPAVGLINQSTGFNNTPVQFNPLTAPPVPPPSSISFKNNLKKSLFTNPLTAFPANLEQNVISPGLNATAQGINAAGNAAQNATQNTPVVGPVVKFANQNVVQGVTPTVQRAALAAQGKDPYAGMNANQRIGAGLQDAINIATVGELPGLGKLGSAVTEKLGGGLGAKVAGGAVSGHLASTAVGAGSGAAQTLQQNDTNPGDIAKNAAISGLLSGAIGAGAGGAAPVVKAGAVAGAKGVVKVATSPELNNERGGGTLSQEDFNKVIPAKPGVKFTDSTTPETTAAVATGEKLPGKLSDDNRWKIIQQENQDTKSNVNLNPAEGNTKGGIAQVTGEVQDLDRKQAYANHLGSKLSKRDQLLLSERADPTVKIRPDNPEAFKKAAAASDDYYDTALDLRRKGGNPTLKYGSGQYAPLNLKITAQEATDKGIPENQLIHNDHGDVVGYRDQKRQYRSYTDAKNQAGLERLNETPLQDLQSYHDKGRSGLQANLLQRALEKTNPHEVSGSRDTAILNGKAEKLQQAPGGLPFFASKNVRNALKNFGDAWEPSSRAGKIAEGAVEKVGTTGKKVLFAPITTFHQAHVAGDVTFANTVGGHPGVALDSAAKSIQEKGGLSRGSWFDMVDEARNDAPKNGISTMDQAKKMGIMISDGSSHLQRTLDAHALAMAKLARDMGIDPTTEDAIAVGKQYNHIIGRENAAVEGINPTLQKITRWYALAPNYLRTRLKLVWDAFAPKFLGGGGYDKLVGMSRPGAAARSAVLGSRLGEGVVATLASIALMQKFPDPQQLVQNFGLSPSNPVPSITLPNKNSKGEQQTMNLATDPLGLAVGLALTPVTDPTDPFHFFQSRESPYLSFATKVATNRDWNGQPLVDTNQPLAWPMRVAKAAADSFTPIGVQNLEAAVPYGVHQNQSGGLSVGKGSARLTPAEALAQNFLATRVRTNPNDPQMQANQKFANTNTSNTNILKSGKFSQLDPSLQDDPKYGAYWADQYNKLHPKDMTGPGGVKFAEPYNPNSSLLKYQAYASVDANGNPVLSPVFYADKRAENSTPGYPSSPLYKLSGNGTDAAGNNSPKALVALQYQFNQDTGAKRDLINSNGGQNGWLAQYENQVGTYSQNYKQNLTNYFQGLGWTNQAVNDYWSKHPESPDPIEQVNLPSSTNDLMNQYQQLSTGGDSTAASKFLADHSSVLGPAFDQLAQHANAIRKARGQLQLQGFPQESAQVKQLLSSMPQGSDKASKAARAKIIQNNPGVNQYLANVALYEALDKGDQFRYKNPSNMSATEGENINAGGAAGQTFLKDVTSLGKYDIGPAPGGGSAFMQGGSLPQGSNSEVDFNKQKAARAKSSAAKADTKSLARATRSAGRVRLQQGYNQRGYKALGRVHSKYTGYSLAGLKGGKTTQGVKRPRVSLKSEIS